MNSEIPTEEIVIIGAGVIGLSIAYELSRQGLSVTVLEKEKVGAGAVWASAGMLAPISEAKSEESELVDFALYSHSIYREFIESIEKISGLNCGFNDTGTLLIAMGKDDEGELEHLHEAQRSKGLSSAWLSQKEIFEIEPNLSGWVTSALLAENDYQVNSRALLIALAKSIIKLGGNIIEEAEVKTIIKFDEKLKSIKYISRDQEFYLQSKQVVICSGAWTNSISNSLFEVDIRPVKGQSIRLNGPNMLKHVIRTSDVYLVSRSNGELVVGGTVEEKGFDNSIQAGSIMDLLRNAWKVFPNIYEYEFRESTIGFRPAALNNLPLISQTNLDNTFVATGHFRHGILLAPGTAWAISEMLIKGITPDIVKPFGLEKHKVF
ncbi:MAG: glycine oxidase ThiO [Chloroflexi bacterium]|jgi:glycine oxidase|nr:glycine oxidase ThiO [Chloroflexota bacterium]MCH2304299.1 glycine oxidase ThiO [SAR202 cluster bacterium]|tara:strand:+ start:187 stop:1320 length:1134 start_codon:yes stop_codon:yes gene_type:complete